ncbi:MAG TPA: DUF3857 and transglutaminase domain-containing protein [Pyrinomonadaceae bacterium]
MNFSQRILPVLFVVLSFMGAGAALANPGDIEWRPVTPEELAMKAPKVEPDADAEAIFWEVRIDDSSDDLSMQHYVRVKIFTDRGREKYSKFDIPFTRRMKIKDLAARVIKPDGSAIEIGKQDIVEREIIKAGGVKVKAKSFAIPSLEAGSIVEYRYREVISDAGAAGMHLKFQRDIPVQTLSYYYKPYSKKAPNYKSFNFADTQFVEGEKGFWVATRKNTPAFKEEPRMPPDDQVIPWILLQATRINIAEFSSFSLIFSFKDPSNPTGYWAAVSMEKKVWWEFMTKPDKEIKRVAEELTASASTPEAKLDKLYEFCQTQIRNTSFDPTLTDDERKKLPANKSVADVLKHKHASAQFTDLLFGALANALGFETRVAFCSDRSELFFKPDMANEAFLHPGAVAVKVGTDWKFYDPGVKFLPPGMLVWYEEGVYALLVGEGNTTWAKTPFSGHDKSLTKRSAKLELLEDGTTEGEVRIEYQGQPGLIYKLDNYDDSDTKREENIKNEVKARMSTAALSNIRIENINDSRKPVVVSYNIRVPGYAQKTGKRLFLQPSFFEHGESALFSSPDRKYDVYFHYPWSESDDIDFQLPPGYALDNAEKPAAIFAGATSQYNIQMGLTTDQRTLVVHRQFYFGGGGNIILPPSSYPQIKALFDRLQKNDEHTITLKQAASN